MVRRTRRRKVGKQASVPHPARRRGLPVLVALYECRRQFKMTVGARVAANAAYPGYGHRHHELGLVALERAHRR